MHVGVASMLMDVLVEMVTRPGGSHRSILLLGPPGVGMPPALQQMLHMHACTCFDYVTCGLLMPVKHHLNVCSSRIIILIMEQICKASALDTYGVAACWLEYPLKMCCKHTCVKRCCMLMKPDHDPCSYR